MIIHSAEDLMELCSSATPEGLHLEYKRKADLKTPRLDKDDKRSIAEAIVSFANSDGGTLIYGIESKKKDGLDVADSLIPIAEIDKLVGEMRLVAELNVSPQVKGLVIEAIPKGDGSGAGFAVCRVPSSDHRPHMSTAPNVHRYYRRSFTGSSIMTPSEVRDQILATREAILEPIVKTGGGSIFAKGAGWAGMKSGFHFKLRNIGNRLCREPFLRVASSCHLTSYTSLFDSRLCAWKTDYPADTLVHVGDERGSLSLDYMARMDVDALLHSERLTVKAILDSVSILPGSDVFKDTSFLGDSLDSIQLSLTFGAENATARMETITFTREELAQQILATCAEALRETFKLPVTDWRQDLFDQISHLER